MTDSGDDKFHNGYEPVVRKRWEQALEAKNAIRSNQPNPSIELKLRAANHIAGFYDVLSRHSDDSALDTPWNQRSVNIDIIDQYFDETVTIGRPANRRGHVTEKQELPKVVTLSATELKQIVNELDQIAKELGFAAETKGDPPLAADTPQVLPDHIVEDAPAFSEAKTDGGDSP